MAQKELTGGIKLLSDIPLFEEELERADSLNFNAYSNVIFNAIKGTQGPFSVGIFGEWGQGKTSLMKNIEKKAKDEKIVSVWFNAWQYELEVHPLIPLLDIIVTELEEHEKIKEIFVEECRNLWRGLKAAFYATDVSFGISETKIGFKTKEFAERKQQLDEADKKAFTEALDNSLYHNAFKLLDKIEKNIVISVHP